MVEAFKIGKGMNFAVKLAADAGVHFAGKGVKRQAAKQPIFWYKPAGANVCRVIFSDLSTADSATAPEVPGAARVGQAR